MNVYVGVCLCIHACICYCMCAFVNIKLFPRWVNSHTGLPSSSGLCLYWRGEGGGGGHDASSGLKRPFNPHTLPYCVLYFDCMNILAFKYEIGYNGLLYHTILYYIHAVYLCIFTIVGLHDRYGHHVMPLMSFNLTFTIVRVHHVPPSMCAGYIKHDPAALWTTPVWS